MSIFQTRTKVDLIGHKSVTIVKNCSDTKIQKYALFKKFGFDLTSHKSQLTGQFSAARE